MYPSQQQKSSRTLVSFHFLLVLKKDLKISIYTLWNYLWLTGVADLWFKNTFSLKKTNFEMTIYFFKEFRGLNVLIYYCNPNFIIDIILLGLNNLKFILKRIEFVW